MVFDSHRRVNIRPYEYQLMQTHPLTSFRSHALPAQFSVRPRASFVAAHAHTKHVRPAFVAGAHSPCPLQPPVEFAHASAVAKHVEMASIGSAGPGIGGGNGLCGGCCTCSNWRLLCDTDAGTVTMASLISGLVTALTSELRTVSMARRYCSLALPYSVASKVSPLSSSAANPSSISLSSDSRKSTIVVISERKVSVAEEGTENISRIRGTLDGK